MNTSMFASISDPNQLLLSMVFFYVKSFSLKCTILANYPHKSDDQSGPELADSLMVLSNYLEEHIQVALRTLSYP